METFLVSAGFFLFVLVGLVALISFLVRRPTWECEGFLIRGPRVEGLQQVLGRARYWCQNYTSRQVFEQLMLIRIVTVPEDLVPADYRYLPAFDTGIRELVGFKTFLTIYVPANEELRRSLGHALGAHVIPGLRGFGWDVNHEVIEHLELADHLSGRF